MEEKSTYRAVRIDDTADWRLVIYISKTRMSAYLKNEEDPMEPLVTLFHEHWNRDDENLLKRIETAVYDHPQLFDDFSTEIIINTERALWIPRAVVEDQTGDSDLMRDEYELYNVVYKSEEEDIFRDELNDKLCLYTLVPGLNSFIRRTLPGARTWCQQTLAVRRFADQISDMPRLYVDIRDGEADYYAFDGRKMLMAATHEWKDIMDITYQVFNLIDIYHLDKANTQVLLSGRREIKGELMALLREHLQYVMLTMLPSSVSKSELPLAIGLAITRR
ncbi:MAG: DUF3822 family protein [Muribaculaceae bacterium]|nr:DUF3822 family protein [Muribaculaceae bacterium]